MPLPAAISAPGKVLFAGGYLVLDRKYSGLVFALNSRVHVLSSLPLDSAEPSSSSNTISVVSPQFDNAQWHYLMSRDAGTGCIRVEQLESDGSKNPFVETTLRYVLNYEAQSNPDLYLQSIKITILADNDYYSQPQTNTNIPIPRFNKLGVALSEAHKTGLGSSAALVTALTACLHATYSGNGPAGLSSSETQRILHNLAQAAHCAAQGKVGSGFDVAAAVYGSCIYRRFSPSILDSATTSPASTPGAFTDPQFPEKLANVVRPEWDFSVIKRRVPPGLRIVMGDVDCGSSTPGMVKKVLSWRKGNPEQAKQLWETLGSDNDQLAHLFKTLEEKSEAEADELASALKILRSQSGPFPSELENSNSTIALFSQISKRIISIRKAIAQMGEAAGVPIEPISQTRLLDYVTSFCPGVLGGVVPGAGGFDAVALLVADDIEVLSNLKKTLERWKFEGGGGARVKVLESREEQEGLKWEDCEGYREWV